MNEFGHAQIDGPMDAKSRLRSEHVHDCCVAECVMKVLSDVNAHGNDYCSPRVVAISVHICVCSF